MPAAAAPCGERVLVTTHDGTRTPYSWAAPVDGVPLRAVAVLLAGGDGHLKLGEDGCPRALAGNFLVRSARLFRERGVATVLVDVPSDYAGPDGLAGLRNTEIHARDLGLVVADVRARVSRPVWVVGTSRGTISATNAASRLTGADAPDGMVISSVLSSGSASYKAWTTQTVYDLPLAQVRIPAFVVGHADDQCRRSPASEMPRVMGKLGSTRKEMLVVQGGSAPVSQDGACEGRSPHGFLGQEPEVVDAIVRFMTGP